MPGYLLRYRSMLPRNMLFTLKDADRRYVIDLQDMLDSANLGPDDGLPLGLYTKSTVWKGLKHPEADVKPEQRGPNPCS
jgi:hypothetical protein